MISKRCHWTKFAHENILKSFIWWFNRTNSSYQDTDDDKEADGGGGHQGEKSVDGEAAKDSDAVDVVEVDLPAQQQQGPESQTKGLKIDNTIWRITILLYVSWFYCLTSTKYNKHW